MKLVDIGAEDLVGGNKTRVRVNPKGLRDNVRRILLECAPCGLEWDGSVPDGHARAAPRCVAQQRAVRRWRRCAQRPITVLVILFFGELCNVEGSNGIWMLRSHVSVTHGTGDGATQAALH